MSLSVILRRSMASLASARPRIVRSWRETNSSSSPLIKPVLSSVSPFRYYSSSASVKRTRFEDTLIRDIEAEIECEGDYGDEDPVNFPFEIKEKYLRQISLSRIYHGETIQINAVVDDSGDDENARAGSESSIDMSMHIDKQYGQSSLVIRCTVSADEIAIRSLTVNDGPDFSDLDGNLQKALRKYLEIRGINRTAAFLREYMTSEKDTRNYLKGLNELKRFIKVK
ncbi:hypothetical protein QQ045_016164 [Rhodiola kirilowii]